VNYGIFSNTDYQPVVYDVEIDDQENIVIILAISRNIISNATTTTCLSVLGDVVSGSRHLLDLFEEEFVREKIKHEIVSRCRQEFDTVYQRELSSAIQDAVSEYGLRENGQQRSIIVAADSNSFWLVLLHRAHVSLDDMLIAMKAEDAIEELSKRAMWAQLMASESEPDWWEVLDL